jgi:hypothetical protein
LWPTTNPASALWRNVDRNDRALIRYDRATAGELSESTRPMRRLVLLLLCCALAAAAAAAPLSAAVRVEIDALMTRLETSGCEFNRNGSWYSGADAKPHLLRKLKYLEDRGAVQTTEQFIELAASGSSMSGQAYLVRCGNAAPVKSAAWLMSQLQAMRAAFSRRAP